MQIWGPKKMTFTTMSLMHIGNHNYRLMNGVTL